MTTQEAALEKALREYRREMENPAKDLALRIIRRREPRKPGALVLK